MKLSQKDTILKKLRSKSYVSLPELMNLTVNGMRIAGITARISDLRAEGYRIINCSHKKKICGRMVNVSGYHLYE